MLTKNAIVGSGEWLSYFLKHPGRFVVGLSVGTLDDNWARRIELGTPSPSERLAALGALQDAGVPTYGMLCPMFPDVLDNNGLESLVSRIQPSKCEHVWAEPYNDRVNWKTVQSGYPTGSAGHQWFTDTYERDTPGSWSRYATSVYHRLYNVAQRDGWLGKLRYLLYERQVSDQDSLEFEKTSLAGVLLQSHPGADGLSVNPYIANLERSVQASVRV